VSSPTLEASPAPLAILERRLTIDAAKKTASRAYYRAHAHGYCGPNFTGAEWLALLLECGGRCLRCGTEDPTVDHVIPLSLGGPNTIENVQVLCAECSSGKGDDSTDFR
jgi:5-methylcytosine-specific restriction endonuclease McrA